MLFFSKHDANLIRRFANIWKNQLFFLLNKTKLTAETYFARVTYSVLVFVTT